MNKARRKEIDKAVALIQEAKDILESTAEEEQEYYDNMPENMQSGEKGERAQSAAESLQEAVGNLDEAINNLETSLPTIGSMKNSSHSAATYRTTKLP